MKLILAFTLSTTLLCACASSGISQIKDNHYVIERMAADNESIKIFQREALAHCQKNKGRLKIIEERLTPITNLADTSAQLTRSKNVVRIYRLEFSCH